jgi:hypothetical protein
MIYLTGDCHGDLKRFSSSNFPEGRELTKDDVVIQLGDFGVIWGLDFIDSEKYWMKWLGNKPWTTLVIQGNHENHDVIEELPVIEKFGGRVYDYEIDDNHIYFSYPGEIFTINDKTFLALPKALSIDQEYRTEGKSWWANELWSKKEEENCLNNLDKINWKVDYVISHTCPQSVIFDTIHQTVYTEGKYYDPTSKLFEFIANKLEFKKWFFGHFHTDVCFTDASGDKYQCLYFTLDELNNMLGDDDEENFQ